jgi:hypothetical protein
MSVTIEKDNPMRDEINRAVDTGILQNRQLTEWRKVLFAILEEYNTMPDGYVITIQGERASSNEPQFINQMRLTLGQLRGMK